LEKSASRNAPCMRVMIESSVGAGAAGAFGSSSRVTAALESADLGPTGASEAVSRVFATGFATVGTDAVAALLDVLVRSSDRMSRGVVVDAVAAGATSFRVLAEATSFRAAVGASSFRLSVEATSFRAARGLCAEVRPRRH
jgi:hypothetical protein